MKYLNGTDKSIQNWKSYPIFDTEGFTSSDLAIREKNTLKEYYNQLKDSNNSLNIIEIEKMHINYIKNIVLKLGLWNGTQYATPAQSDDFIVRFSQNPGNQLAYGSSTPSISATPGLTQSTYVEALSKLWSLKTKTKQTKKQTRTLTINSAEASPPVSYVIDQTSILNNIIYPPGATPGFVCIENVKPEGSAVIGYTVDSSSLSGYGGVTYDQALGYDIYVPSSPNIKVNIVGGSATANEYFSKIQYPRSSSPTSIALNLFDGEIFPIKIVNWVPFEAMSTPITGYIDENGYVGYKKQNGEFVPSKNSDTIIVPEITRETFGISGSSKFEYYFENISILDPADVNVLIWSEQKIVNPFLNKNYVLKFNSINSIIDNDLYTSQKIQYPANSIKEKYDLARNTTVFSNFVARGRLYDERMETRINTGWLHIGKEEYYVYAKPQKEVFTGKLKEITLASVPQAGAPIFIKAYRQGESTPHINYTETAFEDFATPRQFGFYNKELIKPSFDDSFYLSYPNVYDATIVDGLTGEILFEDLSSNSNILSVASSTPIFNKNRNYEISYRVKNSYYADNILNDASYYTKIVFDATPSTPLFYDITYETSRYEQSTPINIQFGETSSFLQKGYVTVSGKDYPFETAQVTISPYNIMDDKKDFIVISISSLDVNKNPKSDQKFTLSSDYLTISPSVVTTNAEGYAMARAVYSAATPVQGMVTGSIRVKGSGADNSSFDKYYTYKIYSSYKENSTISIAADPSIIKADGVSSIFIDGIATKNNLPSKNTIIYWRKGRSPHNALETQVYSSASDFSGYSGIVTTDDNGRFSVGPIVSQSRSNPGYWYIVAESDFKTSYSSDATPVAGDIAYWYESYDNIDLNYVSDLKTVDVINFNDTESLNTYSTPRFITSYYNEQLVTSSGATPRWTPPAWLPIPRYEQYQAGFLGSTPYFISEYINLKKDN